jgi:hypothetical protein
LDLDAVQSEPEPAAAAAEGWGELLRAPAAQRAKSAPLNAPRNSAAAQVSDSSAYGELSFAPPSSGEQAVPLQSAPASHLKPTAASSPAVSVGGEYGVVSLPSLQEAQDAVALQSIPVAPAPVPKPAATRRDAVSRDAVAAQSPPRAAKVPQSRVAKSAPSPEASRPKPRHDDADETYWDELLPTLALPWRSRGVMWLISIGIWALCANLFSALAQVVPFVGTTFVFLVNSSVVSLCAEYHRRCMWAVANGDDALDEGPDFDPARILHHYMRSGTHLIFFALVLLLPNVLWLSSALMADGSDHALELVQSKRFWVFALVPGMYWPMAVATASLYSRFQGVWFVPLGLRAIRRAPFEYASIVVIGATTFLFPWVVCTALTRALGLPAIFSVALIGLPLAASHAVMGALTGQLMRAHPGLFE